MALCRQIAAVTIVYNSSHPERKSWHFGLSILELSHTLDTR
jgi:hypothetical protein